MVNEYIVGLSIDKVQTYLTEAVNAHVQEKQTEEKTLKSIINSSKEISVDFFESIEKVFENCEKNKLMACSGVYIFSCLLPENELKEKLKGLFVNNYINSAGKKLLRYVFFSYNGDEITAIQKAKEELKKSSCLSSIIEQNKDVLFSFQQTEQAQFMPQDNTNYQMFAKDINSLFYAEEAENENRFRIAIIKADLDGMGAMFKDIKSYDDYKKTSCILYKQISLKGLHKAAEACWNDDRTGWIFPLYVAGDDIFFAVSVSNLKKGIDVCRHILKAIKQKLESIKLESLSNKLSMSIGVEITFNRQPIRYYFEMVEEQLKKAKKSNCPSELKDFLDTKISIGGLTFFDIDYKRFKDYKSLLGDGRNTEKKDLNCALKAIPVWSFFISALNLLFYIRNSEECNGIIGTASFFYTLLEKLTDETISSNEKKYINNLLYHLRPKYLENSNEKLWKCELLLNASILQQIYVKENKECKISINDNTKSRLEKYLRLMLLFSDSRFHVSKNIIKDDSLFKPENIENAKKILLAKIPSYLYKEVLDKDLRNFFIEFDRFEKSADKEKDKKNGCNGKKIFIAYYRTVRIEKSMFFKLRDTDKIPLCKAANMLSLNNGKDISANASSTSNQQQGPTYYMAFKRDDFCCKAKKSGKWTPDFVDSLMLFYQYKEALIQYKKLTGNKKNQKT